MIKTGWIVAGVLLEKVSCMAYNVQIFQKSWWSGKPLKVCQSIGSQKKLSGVGIKRKKLM
jgi:hypothetical protein